MVLSITITFGPLSLNEYLIIYRSIKFITRVKVV